MGLVVLVYDAKVLAAYEAVQMPSMAKTQTANRVKVTVNGALVLVKALLDLWEVTSFEQYKLQPNPACAEQEDVEDRQKPAWKLTYEPHATPVEWLAIIREEGSNGDHEMAVMSLIT